MGRIYERDSSSLDSTSVLIFEKGSGTSWTTYKISFADLKNQVASSENLAYNSTTHKLTFTKSNGTAVEVDLSSLVNEVTDVKIDGTSILNELGVANITTMVGTDGTNPGTKGLVPAPSAADIDKFLGADGTWKIPQDTTYEPATTSANGLMSSTDKAKLDNVEANANNYTLPKAAAGTLGGIKVGNNLSIDNNGVLSSFVSSTDITPAVNAWLSANVDPATGYVLDASCTSSQAAAPADKVGELKSALSDTKLVVDAVSDNNYRLTTIGKSSISIGWQLLDNGLCQSDPDYQLFKYALDAGTLVKIKSDYKWQFQSSSSVPSSGEPTRVGITYGLYDGYAVVPEGATYLIIGTYANDSQASCKIVTSIVEQTMNDFLSVCTRRYLTNNAELHLFYAENGDTIKVESADGTNFSSGNAFFVYDGQGSQLAYWSMPTNANYREFVYSKETSCVYCAINFNKKVIVTNVTRALSLDYGAILANGMIDELESLIVPMNVLESNFNNGTSFKCAFISDIHGSSTNFNHAIDFAVDKNLNVLVNGGDTILRYLNDPNDSFSWYATSLGNSGIDVLSAIGNHDCWDGDYYVKASDIDVYNAIVAPIISNFANIVQPTGASSSGLCYYYKDYGNVRLIIINAMSGHASVNYWTTAQGEWLTNVLADAITNSKHVIICAHTPFPKNIANRDAKSDWNSWKDYRTNDDNIVLNSDAMNIVNTFISNGGKFVCWLTGHEHVDSILTANGYEKQFMVNIASGRYNYHSDGVQYSDETSQYYDCIDLCAVDTTNGILKVERVGWNTDYSLKVRDRLSYDYVNGILLHN